MAAIRFEQSSYTVNEANDNVTLHILLTGNLGIPVSAELVVVIFSYRWKGDTCLVHFLFSME